MRERIDSFTGDNAFLSNFHPSFINYEGLMYTTVEHSYQAAKTLSLTERFNIRDLPTPGKAKRAGKKVTLRSDWESIKVGVMENMLRQKFEDPKLREKLIHTFPHELVEGNDWGDTYWGECNGVGENMLGKLLMKIRNEMVMSDKVECATRW